MPNIAITNYCNLACPYCFANTFIQNEKHNITLDELQNVLDFLKKGRSQQYHLGVIGGEPTLHFKFDQILSKIVDFSIEQRLDKPVVFSNGILLHQYNYFFANDAQVLLNLNSPKIVSKENWEGIEKTLNALETSQAFSHNNVKLGINLYLGIPDWNYIFELAKNYKVKVIRCSLVVPACKLTTNNKFEYYEQNKQIFLDFINDAQKNDIKIGMDCNRIPLCFFSDKEQELILKQTMRYVHFCAPVIDIMPNMTAISCFGINQPVDMTKFTNFPQLERYFQFKQIAPLIEKQKTGKCQNCEKIETLECQGGCFSFVSKT